LTGTGPDAPLPDPLQVLGAEGPWKHHDVAANGSRFHVVSAGAGPMVLLLHGFPMFWWTWRHVLRALPPAGYRAVAMDLRGYGGSDHPPHGYDPFTLASDVGAVIRSLGETSAVVVGHGLGGLVGWTMGAVHPDFTRAVAAVGMAHPERLRAALLRERRQRGVGCYAMRQQLPFLPERRLTSHDAARVEVLLRAWSGSAHWPSAEEAATYRAAMLVPGSAYGAVEFSRWAVRSVPRRDGRRYATAMREPVTVPTLVLHGRRDEVVLAATVDGSEQHVSAPYQRVDLDCGHFPHEELPAQTEAALLPWLASLPD
jgi:pimeloyl-ACP methyl ester carboxylesterase